MMRFASGSFGRQRAMGTSRLITPSCCSCRARVPRSSNAIEPIRQCMAGVARTPVMDSPWAAVTTFRPPTRTL